MLEPALKHYKYVRDNDKKNYKACCQIAILYLAKEDYESSAEYLKKCLQTKPNYLPAVLTMGDLLSESDNFETAIKYYNQALALKPTEKRAILGLAHAYYECGNMDVATFTILGTLTVMMVSILRPFSSICVR